MQTEMQTEQLQSGELVGLEQFLAIFGHLVHFFLNILHKQFFPPVGVGAFHSQDLSLPSQDLSQGQQLSQQGPGFGPGASRQAQSFYNSRGMTRGGPRNARGLTNGFRGPVSVLYCHC